MFHKKSIGAKFQYFRASSDAEGKRARETLSLLQIVEVIVSQGNGKLSKLHTHLFFMTEITCLLLQRELMVSLQM